MFSHILILDDGASFLRPAETLLFNHYLRHKQIVVAPWTRSALAQCFKSTPEPSVSNVGEAALDMKLSVCPCLQGLDRKTCISAIVHCMTNLKFTLMRCARVQDLLVFWRLEGRFPSAADLRRYDENQYLLSMDPDSYCNEKKHALPTPGLKHLRPFAIEHADHNCSICLLEIEAKSQVYKLPCGHVFHATDCLGSGSILTWLQANRKCPNCNADVRITASSPAASGPSLTP